MELIKPIIKLGNSAGVVLPKEWLHGKAKIILVEKPINIKKDILEILEQYLEDIVGVYLVGSYARGEETERSDIDILVITNKINKKINEGKYNIILLSKNQLENILKNNALPILPMLKEAMPLINYDLINIYKNTKLTKKNLKWNIKIIKSALEVNKAAIIVDKEFNSECGDSIAYSLILHLRSLYIIDLLKNGEKWNNKGFLNLIKNISGSLKAYEGYLRIKDEKQGKEILPVLEAEKLWDYILKKINEQEKWLKARKE